MTRKILFSTNREMKKANLNSANWKKVKEGKTFCLYAHYKRKYLVLNMNTYTKTGYFKDTRKNKIISEEKKINFY